ncbi:dockerin type I domain-containing protein [Allorhodopirellula solitaria]|uniref:Dockerin type I repeat protein n=1 Tax=Allorhodopirellula solitaria TaxID=2527987 RepID=A0A5C5YK16_9BACT|nr:dockerin type I domain-containing protein [Allorhodopirellula solitaria]TWT75177.1 Dockerin type I repeat protein [Allorhodopirellula solitaria]
MNPRLPRRSHSNPGSEKRLARRRTLRIESLESRLLLAGGLSAPALENANTVQFRFDYSNDTGFFNDHPERRALLEQAGRMITDRLNDTLDAIPPSNSAIQWEAHYTHPATGANTKLPAGFSVAANEIVVFAGSRNLQSLDFPGGGMVRAIADGVNTPFSYSCPATTQAQCTAFGETITTRGEGVTLGANAVDFAPFVASLTFDSRSETIDAWNFEDGPLLTNQVRFLKLAQHELAHVLGFGVSSSFIARASSGEFIGPQADAAYVGAGHLPLNGGHIAQSVLDEQPTIMTSSIQSSGLLSEIDFAVLDDVGWQVLEDQRPAVSITSSADALPEDAGAFELTATLSSPHPTAISIPISLRGTAKWQSDVGSTSGRFDFAANETSATLSLNLVDDEVYEAAETLTIEILDSVHAKLGHRSHLPLTIYDDDGFDLAYVPQTDPATIGSRWSAPGDSQPHGIVFRAGATETLRVQAIGADPIKAGVLLYDQNHDIVGSYGAMGLDSAQLTAGDSYVLVFYPRTTADEFQIDLAGGLNSVPARHNVLLPADVNGSGSVTEVDALQVINQLNRSGDDASVDAPAVTGSGYYDVNGNGLITAVDALRVINFLNTIAVAAEPLAGSLVPIAATVGLVPIGQSRESNPVRDPEPDRGLPVPSQQNVSPPAPDASASGWIDWDQATRTKSIDHIFGMSIAADPSKESGPFEASDLTGALTF